MRLPVFTYYLPETAIFRPRKKYAGNRASPQSGQARNAPKQAGGNDCGKGMEKRRSGLAQRHAAFAVSLDAVHRFVGAHQRSGEIVKPRHFSDAN